MRDLHVVALSEDGRHVVLATTPEAKRGGFRVALDGRLQAAVKGELTRSGHVPGEPMSVREIQARLRAGESVEDLARAGVPLARVERFAGPVLSEREQVVEQARRAVLVRGRRGPSALPLGEAVDLHLSELPSLKADSTSWTSWKGDDGQWTVEVSWFSRGRTRSAQWRFDVGARTVVSLDPGSASLGHVDGEGGAPDGDAPPPGKSARGPRSRGSRGSTAAAAGPSSASGGPRGADSDPAADEVGEDADDEGPVASARTARRRPAAGGAAAGAGRRSGVTTGRASARASTRTGSAAPARRGTATGQAGAAPAAPSVAARGTGAAAGRAAGRGPVARTTLPGTTAAGTTASRTTAPGPTAARTTAPGPAAARTPAARPSGSRSGVDGRDGETAPHPVVRRSAPAPFGPAAVGTVRRAPASRPAQPQPGAGVGRPTGGTGPGPQADRSPRSGPPATSSTPGQRAALPAGRPVPSRPAAVRTPQGDPVPARPHVVAGEAGLVVPAPGAKRQEPAVPAGPPSLRVVPRPEDDERAADVS